MSPYPVWYVKARKRGSKRFAFLTSKGGLNGLRIHAAQFSEDAAKALIADNEADNPEWEFLAVSAL